MMQTVQLAMSDGAYLAAVRDALSHSCAWHVEPVESPDLSQHSVLVLDEAAFERLALPLHNPERVVLIARKDTHQMMAQAWEAGIVSVVSADDPINTVLLAIMAAALRVAKYHSVSAPGGISPTVASTPAHISPHNRISGSKRCKIQ
jgi:hypothetical protein